MAHLTQVDVMLYPTEPQGPQGQSDVILVSIDVEYNARSDDIDQVGISMLASKALSEPEVGNCPSETSVTTNRLLLLKCDYVPRNRHTRQYLFGDAERVVSAELSNTLTNILTPKDGSKVMLIGHSVNCDIAAIRKYCGLDLRTLPSIIAVVDTAYMPAAIFDVQPLRITLKHACRLVGIPARQLQNAGNDAYYTLKLLLLLFRSHKQQEILRSPDLTDDVRAIWETRLKRLDQVGKKIVMAGRAPKRIRYWAGSGQLDQWHDSGEESVGLAAFDALDDV